MPSLKKTNGKSAPAQNKGRKLNDRAINGNGQNKRKSHTAARAKHTKIVVKCNCGFSNHLYIRGEGVKGLSWDKGMLMKCTKADEWVWETDTPFNHAEVKILLNDKHYEVGKNHELDCGKSISFSPNFAA
jgi:hypothetical protein